MRPIEGIVIHCADTPASMDIGADEIRAWHRERGWRDIGYHWVIRRDGTVEAGQPEQEPGAHVAGHNSRTIGVCLVGGKGGANFTAHQWAALEAKVAELVAKYPGVTVKGHRDYDQHKECPCFDVRAWWANHA